MSILSENPSILLGGGTWEQLKDRFLLGAGDTYENGTIGGEATHTLTSAESGVQAHSHGLNGHTHSIPTLSGTAASAGNHNHRLSNGLNGWVWSGGGGGSAMVTHNDGTAESATLASAYAGAHTHSVTTTASTTGGNSGSTTNNTATDATNAHNNMPPYLTVYIWKRIA